MSYSDCWLATAGDRLQRSGHGRATETSSVQQQPGKYFYDVPVGPSIMGHHSAAQRPSSDAGVGGREKSRTIMVIGGILLFVVGFLVTLAAVEDNHASAASDDTPVEGSGSASDLSRNVFLMSGILISLAGVVLATVGPVAGMFKVKQ